MHSNGTSHLIFGPLPQTTYDAPGPISVDTTSHHHRANQMHNNINGYRHHNRGSLRWNHAGISTSAERRLPFVHRFKDLPPPAGPPHQAGNQQVAKSKSAKASTYETNPVGALQERFQSRGITPVYEVVQAEGASHCPTFTYQVFVEDIMASGSGSSKKQAKHAAARAMLDKLSGKEGDKNLGQSSGEQKTPVTITPAAQVATPEASATPAESQPSTSEADAAKASKDDVGNPVGLLQEFCVKQGLPIPVYDVNNVAGQPHQRSFDIICKVGLAKIRGEGSSKKEAKRKSATDMLKKLSDAGCGLQALVYSEDDVHSLCKGIQDIKLDVKSPKLNELQKTSLKSRSFDFVKLLKEIGEEQTFEVDFKDIDEKTDEGQHQVLVILTTAPVTLCHGTGTDEAQAKAEAARNALNYLKAVSKMSSKTVNSSEAIKGGTSPATDKTKAKVGADRK